MDKIDREMSIHVTITRIKRNVFIYKEETQIIYTYSQKRRKKYFLSPTEKGFKYSVL